MKRFILSLLLFAFISFPLYAQESKFANVNGIKLYYKTYGQGEPLLLLHYWSGSSQMWKEHVEILKENYKVIIPDLRGHGKSKANLENFTMKLAAKDIIKLLDQLKIDKVKAIGVSYGGFVLLNMATIQPDRIESMILVATAPYLSIKARDYMQRYSWHNISKRSKQNLIKRHNNDSLQAKALMTTFNSFVTNDTIVNFTPPLLASIRAKTLVVAGENDYLGPKLAFEMHENIPESHIWIVPNAGHAGPVTGSHIPSFLDIAQDFLSGRWDN